MKGEPKSFWLGRPWRGGRRGCVWICHTPGSQAVPDYLNREICTGMIGTISKSTSRVCKQEQCVEQLLLTCKLKNLSEGLTLILGSFCGKALSFCKALGGIAHRGSLPRRSPQNRCSCDVEALKRARKIEDLSREMALCDPWQTAFDSRR